MNRVTKNNHSAADCLTGDQQHADAGQLLQQRSGNLQHQPDLHECFLPRLSRALTVVLSADAGSQPRACTTGQPRHADRAFQCTGLLRRVSVEHSVSRPQWAALLS